MVRRRNGLTGVEQQIMLALVRQHPNGYGVSVREELQRRTGQNWSIGSIYAGFDRLEEQGFIASREGEATAERGGRRKTYFALTALGRQTLDASLAALDALRGYQGLSAIAKRWFAGGVA